MNRRRQMEDFLIREGMVYEILPNDQVMVLDQYSEAKIGPCKVVRSPGAPQTEYDLGTEVLVLEMNYQRYVMGSVVTRSTTIVTEDGEVIHFLGSGRALIGYADGTCGIYSIFSREDGSYISTPIMIIDSESNLKLVARNAEMSFSPAYSESIETDEILLFCKKESKFRSSANDIMPRQHTELKGSVTGISDKKVTSIAPVPANPSILPMEAMPLLPLTVVEETSSLIPKKITYLLAPGLESSVEIGLDGGVTIETPLTKIACSALGQVTISSTVLGSITIDPTGSISIKGKTGVDMVGTGTSLLDVLFDFATAMQTLTVPTGVGPSGPPLNTAKFVEIAAKLKLIKGKA